MSRSLRPSKAEDFVRRTVFCGDGAVVRQVWVSGKACEFPMTPAQAEFLATGRVLVEYDPTVTTGERAFARAWEGLDDYHLGTSIAMDPPPDLRVTLTACGAPEPRPAGADFMRASYRRRT